ncbi:F0F1 ATP synthase subunit gamma [Candidatus Babeliales bacterium]|nr:F0F1 ATP synthase subunit gamma [Candidatus Babeliales bacterium]
MSELVRLKQQIKSIQTTRKITHAVRLVSMSLYARFEKQNTGLGYYMDSIKRSLLDLAVGRLGIDWKNDLLFPEDILDSTPLYIIISSAKGLCGSFNSSLFRYIERSLFIEEHQSPRFIIVGQKAMRFINDKSWGDVICHYGELNSGNYISIANDLVNKIVTSKSVPSSIVFFNSFLKSFFIQEPRKTVFTPLSLEENFSKMTSTQNKNDESIDQKKTTIDYVWEQEPQDVLDSLAVSYIKVFVMNILFQSLLAEQAARFLAMDSATTNADKYLEKLILHYNKQRQSAITREVSELSAGMGP